MEVRLLDRTLLNQIGNKAIEMCGPSSFISRLSHLISSGLAHGQGAVRASRGRALENSPSAARSVFMLQFSQVINSLMHEHVCAPKNIPQEL